MLDVFVKRQSPNDRAISAMKVMIEAIEKGDIDVKDVYFATAPSPYERGLTEKKDEMFFGFSWLDIKHTSEKKRKFPPIKTKHNSNPEELGGGVSSLIPVNPKMTDRKAEEFKSGIDYVCKCGFKTASITGFKKHWNRCKSGGRLNLQ